MEELELKEVIKEITKDILNKTKLIDEYMLTGKGPSSDHSRVEMLAMINDELSDVLLNWDDRLFDNELGDDLM